MPYGHEMRKETDMNAESAVVAETPAASGSRQGAWRGRPQSSYYHANGKGTGSAVRFELHPAHGSTPGSIFVELATQNSVPSSTGAQPSFPTFDWEGRICFKLDKTDLSQFLQVFRGVQESIADGKGLFHRSKTASTIIRFSHQIEPRPGYVLSVSRRSSDGVDRHGYFVFTPSEAFELSVAIESSMIFIAFGVPMVTPEREVAAV